MMFYDILPALCSEWIQDLYVQTSLILTIRDGSTGETQRHTERQADRETEHLNEVKIKGR